MRIVVTGGAGFIGSHLCEFLLSRGHKVICVDNFITGTKENIAQFIEKPKFTLIEQDVTKYLKVDGTIEWVLHFASPASPIDYQRYPIQTLKVGALGTHNTLGLAKNKKAKFLLASSSEVYGDPTVHPQPETYRGNVNPIGPRGVYDEAKRFAEAITMAYHRIHNIDTRIARIFNTYGPRMRLDDGRAIPNFISQALQSKPLTVYGDGSQTRSFCYVDDLIQGIYALMKSKINLPVNIGNPHEFTILELAKLILKLVGADFICDQSRTVTAKLILKLVGADFICDQSRTVTAQRERIIFKPLPPDDPKLRRPDITIAREKLKWQPKVSLKQGLKKTILYFSKTVDHRLDKICSY